VNFKAWKFLQEFPRFLFIIEEIPYCFRFNGTIWDFFNYFLVLLRFSSDNNGF
jgi:hypothetical protein